MLTTLDKIKINSLKFICHITLAQTVCKYFLCQFIFMKVHNRFLVLFALVIIGLLI